MKRQRPPHPFAIVFQALMTHAGYGEASSEARKRMGIGALGEQFCDKACCRFMVAQDEPEAPPVDVGPMRRVRRTNRTTRRRVQD